MIVIHINRNHKVLAQLQDTSELHSIKCNLHKVNTSPRKVLTSPKLEELVPWKGSQPTLSRKLLCTGLRRGRLSASLTSGLLVLWVTVIVELIDLNLRVIKQC